MNSGLEANHSSIEYYDSDYPSAYFGPYPENFDATTTYQGIAHDIPRYIELAKEAEGPILELCCGTGRVTLPLAQAGLQIVGVDISASLLKRFRENLESMDSKLQRPIELIEQDITQLNLAKTDFNLAICAFNSLLCIPDFADQIKALKGIARHLRQNGKLVLDIVNPLALNFKGDSTPKAFFTRKNVRTGNSYTRFAMASAFDDNQRQQLYGWYDEIFPNGSVARKLYSLYWRPIFRFEIELMLKEAGFKIHKIEGGHRKESFSIQQSPRMFIQAIKQN